MDKFTLCELKFAGEIIFPEDFERLWQAHAPLEHQHLWYLYGTDIKRNYNGNTVAWMMGWSRASMTPEIETAFGKIIREAITVCTYDYP